MLKTRRSFLTGVATAGAGILMSSAGCIDVMNREEEEDYRPTADPEELEAEYEVYMEDQLEGAKFEDIEQENEYWVDDDYMHRIEGSVKNTSGNDYDNVTVKGQLYGALENDSNPELGLMLLGHDTEELGLLEDGDTKEYTLAIPDYGVENGIEGAKTTRYGIQVRGDKHDNSFTTTHGKARIL